MKMLLKKLVNNCFSKFLLILKYMQPVLQTCKVKSLNYLYYYKNVLKYILRKPSSY